MKLSENTVGVTIGLRNLDDVHIGSCDNAVVIMITNSAGSVGLVLYDREMAAGMADLFLAARDRLDDYAQTQLDLADADV